MEKSETPYERLVSRYLTHQLAAVDTRICIALIQAVFPHWSNVKPESADSEIPNETLPDCGRAR